MGLTKLPSSFMLFTLVIFCNKQKLDLISLQYSRGHYPLFCFFFRLVAKKKKKMYSHHALKSSDYGGKGINRSRLSGRCRLDCLFPLRYPPSPVLFLSLSLYPSGTITALSSHSCITPLGTNTAAFGLVCVDCLLQTAQWELFKLVKAPENGWRGEVIINKDMQGRYTLKDLNI